MVLDPADADLRGRRLFGFRTVRPRSLVERAVPFRAILETLVAEHEPIVRGAIFCDDEGERVDSSAGPGTTDDDLALAGACIATVAKQIPGAACLRVALAGAVVWVATVESGCFLVVVCDRGRDGAVLADLPRAVAALAAHM